MRSQPLITMIVPSFNAEASISRCLDSIINQTFQDYETLVIDGSSSDNTLNIVQSFSAQNARIICNSEKDKGIYDAMNKGIEMANGEWLLFLGSDDQLYDDKVLENIAGALRSASTGNIDMVYGNVKVIGEAVWARDGDNYDGPFTVKKLFLKNICHQSIFYKKSVFAKVG